MQAARTDAVARFAVAPPDIISELEDVVMEATAPDERFRFRLTARRLREVSNTMYKEFPAIRERHPYNAAYLHPDDLTELGLVEGDRARIVSDHGEISAIVDVDESVRRGVVSMSHGWGGLPDDPISDQVGVSTSLLISTDRNLEVINAMPRMSSIPVFIEKDVVNPNRDTRVRRRHVSR